MQVRVYSGLDTDLIFFVQVQVHRLGSCEEISSSSIMIDSSSNELYFHKHIGDPKLHFPGYIFQKFFAGKMFYITPTFSFTKKRFTMLTLSSKTVLSQISLDDLPNDGVASNL